MTESYSVWWSSKVPPINSGNSSMAASERRKKGLTPQYRFSRYKHKQKHLLPKILYLNYVFQCVKASPKLSFIDIEPHINELCTESASTFLTRVTTEPDGDACFPDASESICSR